MGHCTKPYRWLQFYRHIMSLIYYIILGGFIVILLFIKLIFGSLSIFTKAILGHIFSDFAEDLETFRKWDKEHDIRHKMNLLYAVILGVFVLSFLLYTQV